MIIKELMVSREWGIWEELKQGDGGGNDINRVYSYIKFSRFKNK